MPDDPETWLHRVRANAGAGDHLLAYDVALRGLAEHPGDAALQHAAVLALARSGATAKASERYREFALGQVPSAAVAAALRIDIAALGARIAKDLALSSSPEQRPAL